MNLSNIEVQPTECKFHKILVSPELKDAEQLLTLRTMVVTTLQEMCIFADILYQSQC